MSFSVGQILAASELSGGPQNYTPELSSTGTNPDLGSGATQNGWWLRTLQRVVMFEVQIQFGTGSAAGTGLYDISMPTPADGAWHNDTSTVGAFSVIGSGAIRDDSVGVGAGSFKVLIGISDDNNLGAGGVALCRMFHMDGSSSTVQATAPFTWADGDRITFRGQYIMPLD